MSQISERAQHLLKSLIDRYIRDGQPVASKTLMQETTLGLSSATIRGILADLEEAGLLASPHTSAGRVPTAQGYRFFVDSLLKVQPLEPQTVGRMQSALKLESFEPKLLKRASSLLSKITQLACIVSLPKRDYLILRHIEFLPLSDNRVLVVLVLNDKEVQNRIIYTDRKYTRHELQEATNYLSSQFGNQDLHKVRQQVWHAMQADKLQMDSLAQATMLLVDEVLDDCANTSDDYIMVGQSNLLDLADTTGLDKLRQLFSAFAEKQSILHLLDKCLNSQGLQLFIGDEAGEAVLEGCSMVTTPYAADGEVIGVLGVIGPTRMPYQHVIPAVDVTAKLLSAALSKVDSSA